MPKDPRGKYEVLQWLYWQMANLGPNSGQANHFRNYAAEKIAYGVNRYTDEVNRLYGVMNIQLADHGFLAGAYSIADMASWPWVILYERMGQDLNEFPHLKRWVDTIQARPAVVKGKAVGEELRAEMSEEAKKVLFGQRARK